MQLISERRIFQHFICSTTSQSLTVQLQRKPFRLCCVRPDLLHWGNYYYHQRGRFALLPVTRLSLIRNVAFNDPTKKFWPIWYFWVTEGEKNKWPTSLELQSLDLDADPQNGIQLNSTEVSKLNPNIDFSDNSSFAGLAVPRKELCAIWPVAWSSKSWDPGAFTTISSSNDDHAPLRLIGASLMKI